MPKGVSSVQRSMKYLKTLGLKCTVAEKFNPHVGQYGIRQDMFGFIDIIALDPSRGIIGVQACGGGEIKAHERKIFDNEEVLDNVIDWLEAGGLLEFHGWRKLKVKRGGKAMRWVPKIIEYKLDDFI